MIKNLQNKTLLYAEDEIGIQELYAKYFRNIFKEVFVASDGNEAKILNETKKPDAIILDINMPFINGIELIRQIRQTNDELPILILSARSDKETFKEAIELNLVTYLEKPVAKESLKEALEKLAKKFQNKEIQYLWKETNTQYIWHTKNKQLFANDTQIMLTKNETKLLEFFVIKKTYCNYQEIYEFVWEDSDKEFNESTIKSLLCSLKSKLPKDAIKNQYGMGYLLHLK